MRSFGGAFFILQESDTLKFGMRKPSFKRSLKARTTGKWKRKAKKSLIPGYGKKGVGWLKNPKKAAYNKVYNKTTFSLSDLFKFRFKKAKNNAMKTEVKEDDIVENKEKAPFYQKTWFMIVISILFPVVGIALMWVFKRNWNKIIKIILTVIASIWTLMLLIIVIPSGNTPSESTGETTTQAVTEESTTHESTTYESTVAAVVTEVSTTEQVTEESTTATTKQETTTAKQTTTKKETTTAKPTTTKKETTTTKPTTTKKETTTAKPTTTQKETTTKKVATTSRDEGITVYRTKSGEKYHYENPCGNGTYYPITLAEAKRIGLGPCDKCVNH